MADTVKKTTTRTTRATKTQATKTETVEQGTKIVTSTIEEERKNKVKQAKSDDVVYVACSLPFGIKFTDVDAGGGRFKTVKFPGVNHELRGKPNGILVGAGNAVLVAVDRQDWENIKLKHGKERIFTALPPKLWEFKSESDFRAARSEVAEMSTGVEPIDPKSAKVEEVTDEE